MKNFLLSPLALLLFLSPAFSAEPPEKALKYHEALLKRPSNDTLFDRFFSAWIDEQDITELEKFLTTRAEQNNGPDLAILSRFHLRRGNEDAALESLAKAITALPDDYSLPLERAKILLRRLDFDNARKDLTTVSNGTDPVLALEASKLIGKSFLREGNSPEAIKTWDAILAKNPNDEDLLEDLVESAATENEIDQALIYIEKLITASSDPYKKTLRQLRRGDLLAQAARHDDAIKAYCETLTNTGEGSWLEREIIAQIDKAFRKQDRIDDLNTTLETLATENPRRLLIHRELARLEAAQGDPDAAIGRFREVLKRSPGNSELVQEFIRLLTDSEKFDTASEELDKLITQAPQDASLLFQLAELHFRQNQKPETLATLQKAHTLLGIDDESAGIRIAALMFQYGLNENGETILKKISSAPNATEAPSEALASEYARTNRKPEALEILKKIANTDNLDTLLRSTGSISALGEPNTTLEVLTAKTNSFQNETRFLTAITQAALAANKPDIATTHAIKLIRSLSPSSDIAEPISLALRAIIDSKQSEQWRNTLLNQNPRSNPETCLLAALAETDADFDAVTQILSNTTDPTLIRFHTAILDRRGELDQAIKILSTLSSTNEGRKTSFFKDLADLQRRAGLVNEALETVDLWKQSNPSDKTAWINQTNILRDEGRPEEAIKTARQASARFGEDTELTATLASLHQDAGQPDEAEAIYWRLYDNAASPSDQARWASLLAELAHSTGRTEELSEKLLERARNNRRSLGPILAQAELARITRNEEKRRDLLLEAVRLQPKDIDLRLQIANLEEQSGNHDRLIAILEEALPFDSNNRIRSSLAQAYIRQGHVLKGMRELRILAGSLADDPRTIEQSAASLAQSGLYEEAIRFLRESLPDGGDWRTQYLLAILLEHDGRETEAIPLFKNLLQASAEIPSIKIPKSNRNNYYEEEFKKLPTQARKIIDLISASQAAYAHKNEGGYWGGYGNTSTNVSSFMLPNGPETVRSYSLIHLVKLKANETPDSQFLQDFLDSTSEGQPNFPQLLSKHPEHPGLLDVVLLFAGWDNTTTLDLDILRNAIAKRNDLSPTNIFQASLIFARAPDAPQSAWDDLVSSAKSITQSPDKKQTQQIAYALLALIAQDKNTIPASTKKDLSQIVIDLAKNDAFSDVPFDGFQLYAINIVGTTEQWIEAANKEIDTFRKKFPKGPPFQPSSNNRIQNIMPQNYGGSPTSPIVLPSIDSASFLSLPSNVLSLISPGRRGYVIGKNITPNALIPLIESFSSPALRAWIAISANDMKAIEKYLNVTPPENEVADFITLKTFHAINQKNFSSAYQHLSSLRSILASDRNRISELNLHILAIAAEMPAEERSKIAAELEPIIIQVRRSLGTQNAAALAAHAHKLGLTELAKRINPKPLPQNTTNNPGGATFGSNPQNRPGSSNASIEKMKKFASEGKHEAAALEALSLLRKAYKNEYRSSYEISQIREAIAPETITQLLAITDPGDSTSLTKITEYANICSDFATPEQTLTILRDLHSRRPNDSNIAAKLAFILPPSEKQKSIELLSTASSSDSFADIAFNHGRKLSENRVESSTFSYFDSITSWLESSTPEQLANTNLSWVSYHAKSFFDGQYLSNNSSLPRISHEKISKDHLPYVNLAKRLALAMLKHPATAEEGFRLIRHSTAWKFSDSDLDNHARNTLLHSASLQSDLYQSGNHSHFMYRTRNGSSGSGHPLDELSSVQWLSSRLKTAKSPDEILPPSLLSQLTEKNKAVGDLATALVTIKTLKDFESVWNSGSFTKSASPTTEMLCNAIREHASTIPGTDAFFLNLVQNIKPLWFKNNYNRNDSNILLIRSAITSSSQSSPQHISDLCDAITKAIFAGPLDINTADDSLSYAINVMEQIFSDLTIEPITAQKFITELHKKNYPCGQEYTIREIFSKIDVSTPQNAVKSFQALSWLDPIESWQPLLIVSIGSDYIGGKQTFKQSEKFLLPDIIRNLPLSRTDIIKLLENQKPQTFGSLITAAAIASESERSRLTALAFSQNAKQIAALPQKRLNQLNHLVTWLPENAIPSLPPALRKQHDQANQEKITGLINQADAFLTAISDPNNPQIGHHVIAQAESLVLQLIPLDLNKSIAVFLEAEKLFTQSLSTGGQLSTYSTNNIQITQRDEAVQDIISSLIDSDVKLALAFHNALANSPAATRFSFAATGDYTPILYNIGLRISTTTPTADSKHLHHSLRPYFHIKKLPANIQNDAYFALGTYLIGNKNHHEAVKGNEDRVALEKNKDIPEIARHISTLHIGVSQWGKDTLQRKLETQKAFSFIANFAEAPPSTRFQLLFVAAYMTPALLADPIIADTFAKSFEEYAAAERSVINTLGLHTAHLVSKSPVIPECEPLRKRLNTAFWKNTNSSKPAGHPEIPQTQITALLMASCAARDDQNVSKLFNLAKADIIGNATATFALITHGYFDLAKQSLCPLNKFHPLPDGLPTYHSIFEKQFNEFRKTPGINPISLLRYEALLLDICPNQIGEFAPSESIDQRQHRVISTYLENPPEDLMLRTEIVARLTRNSHIASIALRDHIFELRKPLDLSKSLDDWGKGTGQPTDLIPRYSFAPAECVIIRQHAFLRFIEGDLSPLRDIVPILHKQPAISSHSDFGARDATEMFFDRLHESAPLWICEAIQRGQTAHFKDAIEIFNDFLSIADNRREFQDEMIARPLSYIEFFSHWNGDGQFAIKAYDNVKREKGNSAYFRTPQGYFRMSYYGAKNHDWNRPAFRETRRNFLITCFTRKEMVGCYTHNSKWLTVSANNHSLRDDILAIAASPPQDTLPTVLPHLLKFRADDELKNNRFDSATTALLSAINACPDQKPWNETRLQWSMALCEKYLAAKKPEEALKFHAQIKTEGLNPQQTKNLQILFDKIQKAIPK